MDGGEVIEVVPKLREVDWVDSDWVRTVGYKGKISNAIRYYVPGSLQTNRIEDNGQQYACFPGRSGFIMILEYYKKDKRLEKLS